MRAYSAGWKKYVGFCVINSILPTDHNLPWPKIFECFLIYCVEDAYVKIRPETADGYVTHVLKVLERHDPECTVRQDVPRSKLYKAALAAFNRDVKAAAPRRLTARIPFTIPFILWSFDLIDKSYDDDGFRRCLKAAFAAGHAFSLRPGEYLRSSHNYERNRYLNAATTYAWFDGIPYAATATNTWPIGIPSYISSILDVRKNTLNSGAPVAVAANPRRESPRFCCVELLADYIRQAALTENDPLFVHNGEHVGTSEMSLVMKKCAMHFDVDPARVMPACLRKNAITQMALNTPSLIRHLQGGWKSDAGEEHYWAPLLQLADEACGYVHSTGSATIEVIHNIFSASLRMSVQEDQSATLSPDELRAVAQAESDVPPAVLPAL